MERACTSEYSTCINSTPPLDQNVEKLIILQLPLQLLKVGPKLHYSENFGHLSLDLVNMSNCFIFCILHGAVSMSFKALL